MPIDPETAKVMREAIKRVLDGREEIPGDLPYPPLATRYVLGAAFPDQAPAQVEFTKRGRATSKAVRQVYLAGYRVGRAGDEQIGAQVREALHLGATATEAARRSHPYVGLAVCIVCDQAPDHHVHDPIDQDAVS